MKLLNKILCIIPARSGSTGLPNKNVKNLLGKPLIEWSIDAALKSRLISRIIISTDSKKVIKICKKKYDNKIDIPFKRPSSISRNNSPISKTIIQNGTMYRIRYRKVASTDP